MPPQVIDVPAYILLAILGIAMSFWGRQLARFLSSITFAAFLSYTTWIYSYSLWRSTALAIILVLIAMIIGLATGFMVFRLAISTIFAYIVAGLIVSGNTALFLIIFILLTAVMYIASKHLLPVLFALTGSVMVFKALTVLGLHELIATALCAVVFTLGYYNQVKSKL